MQSAGAVFLQERTAGKKRLPLKQQIPPAQMHRGDFKYQKLLNVFDYSKPYSSCSFFTSASQSSMQVGA